VDWGIIAQATFFVAIGLLAIVITVYVFSTSLLGLAVERTSRELREQQEAQKESTNHQLEGVRKSLDKAQEDNIGQEVQTLRESLAELERKLRKDEKDLADIPKKYTLPFTVRGGVLFPGLGFLLAAIFSGVAWSLANNITPVLHVFWALAVASIIYGLYRLRISLRAVEDISIGSEEAALKRTVEAFKMAQKELEEERKPKLLLTFLDPIPPIQTKPGEAVPIRFAVTLSKGDIARLVTVAFFAPPAFDFITKETDWVKRLQDVPKAVCPGDRCAILDLGLVMRAMGYNRLLTIKAPASPGSFSLAYRLQCEGGLGQLEEFEVIVAPE